MKIRVCLFGILFVFCLGSCAGEYDQARFTDNSYCKLPPNVQYTFHIDSPEPSEAIVGRPDQYIPKCCTELTEVCHGSVLTISCRDYVETWIVLDSIDGVMHLFVENKGPSVAEFHLLTAGALEVDDGGT